MAKTNYFDTVSFDLRDRIPFSSKKARNWEWAKRKADYYDRYNNRQYWSEKYNRIKANYDLFNGKWDSSSYSHIENPYNVEDFATPTNLEHVDVCSLPLREMVGAELKRPFNITAVAINADAASKRRRERLKLLKEYVYNEIMGPVRQELMSQFPEPQSEEEAQQIQQQLQEQEKAMTPEEIQEYMSKHYKLPEEETAQKIINILVKELDLQLIFNEGWKDAVITGEEIYYVGQKNKKPYIESINPMNFNYDKSPHVRFIQDSEWCTYERMMLVSDVYDMYGQYLTEKDMKKLDTFFDKVNYSEEELLTNTAVLLDTVGDIDSVHLLDRYIRVVHICFTSLKKIKFITRLNPETMQEEVLVTDETYKFDNTIDLEEEIAWIPEEWEVTKIGEDIYCNIGPVENQYRDLNKPYETSKNYYGIAYKTKNSDIISPLDRAKYWQIMYNIIWFRLQETLATDRGNVLLAVLKQIPKGWTPHKWLQYLSVTKVGFLDTTQDVTPVGTDPQYWKSINLSNNQDLQKYINLLEYCEQKCVRTTGSNENRIGTVSPYETATNNQQRIIQSSNITEPEFYLHNLLKEKVMTGLLEQAKLCYKENPTFVSFVLDDFSAGDLRIDTELLNSSEYGVYITNSTDDQFTVDQLRLQLDRLIQVSQGDLRIVAEVLTTKNPASIKKLIDKVADELAEAKAQQSQIQQQQIQANQQIEQQRAEDFKREKQLDREYRLKEAYIRALGYNNENDLNTNNVPDVLEAAKFNSDLSIKLNESELKQKEIEIRERELTENNNSEERDRQVELEKIRSNERIQNQRERQRRDNPKK